MQNFYDGLAEILEVDASAINSEFDLTSANWDSLAMVSSIALIDECYNKIVSGTALAKCKRVSDIELLIDKS